LGIGCVGCLVLCFLFFFLVGRGGKEKKWLNFLFNLCPSFFCSFVGVFFVFHWTRLPQTFLCVFFLGVPPKSVLEQWVSPFFFPFPFCFLGFFVSPFFFFSLFLQGGWGGGVFPHNQGGQFFFFGAPDGQTVMAVPLVCQHLVLGGEDFFLFFSGPKQLDPVFILF